MSLIQSPRSVKEATDPSTPDEEPPLKKEKKYESFGRKLAGSTLHENITDG